jgi:hypothetical protein
VHNFVRNEGIRSAVAILNRSLEQRKLMSNNEAIIYSDPKNGYRNEGN